MSCYEIFFFWYTKCGCLHKHIKYYTLFSDNSKITIKIVSHSSRKQHITTRKIHRIADLQCFNLNLQSITNNNNSDWSILYQRIFIHYLSSNSIYNLAFTKKFTPSVNHFPNLSLVNSVTKVANCQLVANTDFCSENVYTHYLQKPVKLSLMLS